MICLVKSDSLTYIFKEHTMAGCLISIESLEEMIRGEET